jgi:hypothetical protein
MRMIRLLLCAGLLTSCTVQGSPGPAAGPGTYGGTPTAGGQTAGQPLGCFKDQGDPAGISGRDLDGHVVNAPDMSTSRCLDECSRSGFAYAGTQYSTWCFCGNQYGRSGEAQNCDMACGGAAGEKCGGAWANSVYATGMTPGAAQPAPVIPATPVAPAAPSAPRGQPVGCFKDQGDPTGISGRDLDGHVVNAPDMSTSRCLDECSRGGFAYAGTQYSTWCFCGNQYGRSGEAQNCDMACGGAAGEKCGGAWANSVYTTGVAPR